MQRIRRDSHHQYNATHHDQHQTHPCAGLVTHNRRERPTGFGGAPDGAAQTVKIGAQNWTQMKCVDAKNDKTAVVASILYNKQFYYMAYGSPTIGFPTNTSQYFTTMQQSFSFAA